MRISPLPTSFDFNFILIFFLQNYLNDQLCKSTGNGDIWWRIFRKLKIRRNFFGAVPESMDHEVGCNDATPKWRHSFNCRVGGWVGGEWKRHRFGDVVDADLIQYFPSGRSSTGGRSRRSLTDRNNDHGFDYRSADSTRYELISPPTAHFFKNSKRPFKLMEF